MGIGERIEGQFVDTFFIGRKRERIKYEMSKADKRQSMIMKMDRYFDERYCQAFEPPVTTSRDVLTYLESRGMGDECYVIADDRSLDKRVMNVGAALERIVFVGFAVVISLKRRLAFYEGELGWSSRDRWLLMKEGRWDLDS
ncbi:hypothetical protein ACH6CV_12135 [Bacillota bacterium Meth-B3]